jgi:hypothetical protein
MKKLGPECIFWAIAERTSRFLRRFSSPQQSAVFDAKFLNTRKIGKVWCINLDRQSERWKHVQSELGRIRDLDGLPLTNMLLRVSAIDATINNVPPDRREIEASYTLKE